MNVELPTAENPVVVVHGDALDVLRTLPDGCVDAVVTDPPYGVGFKYASHDDGFEEYAGIIERIQASERVVAGGGFMAVYQSANHARHWHEWFPQDWQMLALPKTFTQGGRGVLVPATDYVLWWRVGNPTRNPREWQEGMARNWFVCNTQPQNRDAHSRGHPCPRPIDGVRYVVRNLVPPCGVVADIFGGSGTTAVAALHEGRRCLIVEKDAGYCDIIRRRVAEAQGVGPGSFLKPEPPSLFGDEPEGTS